MTMAAATNTSLEKQFVLLQTLSGLFNWSRSIRKMLAIFTGAEF